MRKRGHGSDDGDTSSTESEHDSFRMLAGHIRSDDDDFLM
jgi:hypothetical protein